MMEAPYTYIFIRKDLPIPQQIVQASHAAQEAGHTFDKRGIDHIVLVGVDDKNKLLKVAQYLEQNDVKFCMFNEPDYDTGYTAIATEPLCGEQRRILRKFQLYKGT